MATVGIVGLGLIGGALTKRLVQQGVAPMVFDLKREKADAAVEAGAAAAASAREVAERCDVVILSVQTDEQCIAAVSGEEGLLAGARPGSCIAVLATVKPVTIATLAAQAADRGVALVDTPVAGRGQFSVEDGTMSVLVGDDGELVKKLEPTLRLFASRVVPAGRLGAGAALKLAHNVIVYAGFAAMLEADRLARAAGVPDGLLEEIARASGALSDLSAMHHELLGPGRDGPVIPNQDEALRVAAALVDKDLSDAVELARDSGVDLPVAQLLSHSGEMIFGVQR